MSISNDIEIPIKKKRRPGGGRKKAPGKLIELELQRAKDEELPAIIRAMIEKAKAGDTNLCIYLCDRLLGRPKQEIDARIKAQVISITPDEYELATRLAIMEEERLLLNNKS